MSISLGSSGPVTFLYISTEAAMSDSSLLFMAGANTVEEQRARWERKRSRTAKELLETEHKYFEQLDLVVTVSILSPSDIWLPSGSVYLFVLSWGRVKSKTSVHPYCMRQLLGLKGFFFYLLCNIQQLVVLAPWLWSVHRHKSLSFDCIGDSP